MYARVSTLEGSPGQIDEGLRHLKEEILPTGKDDPGFKGLIALADRNSGKTLSITLWESEEEMRATEQDANQLRSAWAETSGQEVASVESYEVGLYEVPSAGPVSGVTDTVSGVTEPVSGVTDTVRGTTDKLLGGGGGEKQR